MRVAWLGLTLALGGCDVVFGLGDPTTGDAGTDCGTHDEDHDGRPDGCDPCPMIDDAAGGFADSDDDGVGDACDPTPMIACEQRLAFFGFGGPVADLAFQNGSWQQGNDSIDQTDAQTEDALAHLARGYKNVSLRARITVTPRTTLMPASAMEIVLASQQHVDTSGIVGDGGCTLYDEGDGSPEGWIYDDSGNFHDPRPYTGPLGPSVTLELRSDEPASGADRCEVVGIAPVGKLDRASQYPRNAPADGTEVALMISNASVRIEWLDVIQLCQ